MKIIIKEEQLKVIKEYIDPMEGTTEISSVQTLVDGKRGVCFVASLNSHEANVISDMIYDNNLEIIKVPSNPHEAYIIFKPDYKENAIKLLNIAEKYDGYLAWYAEEDDSREIGRLLEYDPDSVEDFIRRMNIQKLKKQK